MRIRACAAGEVIQFIPPKRRKKRKGLKNFRTDGFEVAVRPGVRALVQVVDVVAAAISVHKESKRWLGTPLLHRLLAVEPGKWRGHVGHAVVSCHPTITTLLCSMPPLTANIPSAACWLGATGHYSNRDVQPEDTTLTCRSSPLLTPEKHIQRPHQPL